jgi:antitoxin component of MazEF toxin-antitoxin module
MEVKIRSIGNSVGIIFPKRIAKMMNFHIEDVIELDIDTERKRLIVERKKQSLKENLLDGIKASQEENLAFVNDFDELEGEI